MKKLIKIILTSVFITGAGVIQATTGNELLADLKDESSAYNRGYALGFVRAVTESFAGFGLGNECLQLPSGVTTDQTKDVVIKFLENNPEVRHMSAPVLIKIALRESYSVKSESSAGFCE